MATQAKTRGLLGQFEELADASPVLSATSAGQYAQRYARAKRHAHSAKVTSRRTASNALTCRVTWRANGKKRTRTLMVKRTSAFGVTASTA